MKLGAHGTGSSSATHPAAVFGPGGRPAGDSIVAERVTKGAVEQVYWRYEDQLNSCVGQADENGWRTMQNSYLAFGEVMQSRVLYDGAVSRLSAVEYDGLALTTITLANNDLSTDLLNGALLFLARPGYNGNRHMEAVVVDSTANSIVVEDLTGDLFEALGPEGRPIAGFVIFAFNDSKQANAPTYQTHGTWTSAPSYASSQTTFTDADADDNGGGFAGWMIGSILVPDVNIGAPLLITGATATTLTVAGDARGIASNGSQYIIYAAPFTDPVRGTWQTDPHKGGTRYLWAGYRYQPPQMGFWVDPPGAAGLGVYGAATGTNRLGQYYCWNRTYDINTGRWTTPDPVANPFFNLFDFASCTSVMQSDPSGLTSITAKFLPPTIRIGDVEIEFDFAGRKGSGGVGVKVTFPSGTGGRVTIGGVPTFKIPSKGVAPNPTPDGGVIKIEIRDDKIVGVIFGIIFAPFAWIAAIIDLFISDGSDNPHCTDYYRKRWDADLEKCNEYARQATAALAAARQEVQARCAHAHAGDANAASACVASSGINDPALDKAIESARMKCRWAVADYWEKEYEKVFGSCDPAG